MYYQKDLERYSALLVLWDFTWMLIQNNSLVLAPQAKIPSSTPDGLLVKFYLFWVVCGNKVSLTQVV